MRSDALGYFLTGLIVAGAVYFAGLLGFELSWRLMLLILGTGIMTETACLIYRAKRPHS